MGVYQRALEYERGSLMTFDGSTWCANERTRDHQSDRQGPVACLVVFSGIRLRQSALRAEWL
jgi:hypothetical protein